jgi:hypothetical protein
MEYRENTGHTNTSVGSYFLVIDKLKSWRMLSYCDSRNQRETNRAKDYHFHIPLPLNLF